MIGETRSHPASAPESTPQVVADAESVSTTPAVKEIGGRDGLDPTRYGDWEKNGRCIDF